MNKGLEVVIREISIHALRKEGDHLSSAPTFKFQNFYPRPPQGGRLVTKSGDVAADIFLSTPSARRATREMMARFNDTFRFLSTPSARRATERVQMEKYSRDISIHALREEGDVRVMVEHDARCTFLSTPSARRATAPACIFNPQNLISIHALREEGDLQEAAADLGGKLFLSTPSVRRATARRPCC